MCCCCKLFLLWMRPPALSWRESDGARLAEFYEKEAAVQAEAAAPTEVPPSYASAILAGA